MKELQHMSDSGKARFPTTEIFRSSLNHVNSEVMPSCMHIERAAKNKVHQINSVNLFSDSDCSRRQRHSLAVSLSSLRTQSIISNF